MQRNRNYGRIWALGLALLVGCGAAEQSEEETFATAVSALLSAPAYHGFKLTPAGQSESWGLILTNTSATKTETIYGTSHFTGSGGFTWKHPAFDFSIPPLKAQTTLVVFSPTVGYHSARLWIHHSDDGGLTKSWLEVRLDGTGCFPPYTGPAPIPTAACHIDN